MASNLQVVGKSEAICATLSSTNDHTGHKHDRIYSSQQVDALLLQLSVAEHQQEAVLWGRAKSALPDPQTMLPEHIDQLFSEVF